MSHPVGCVTRYAPIKPFMMNTPNDHLVGCVTRKVRRETRREGGLGRKVRRETRREGGLGRKVRPGTGREGSLGCYAPFTRLIIKISTVGNKLPTLRFQTMGAIR